MKTNPKATLYNLANNEAAVILTKARDAEIEYVRNSAAANKCCEWYDEDSYQTKCWRKLEREAKAKMDDFGRQYDELLDAMGSLKIKWA